MLDRASTFADSEIVQMLHERFVPVAIDQAYQRRQQDTEGEFYRQIAGQGPRSDFKKTTQGLYIADPSGKLIAYNNNRGADRIRRLMEQALADYTVPDAEPLTDSTPDPKYDPQPPDGGIVVRVYSKILDGYAAPTDEWAKIFQCAIGRDNLWITAEEHAELVAHSMPDVLAQRIARFHCVDNTRGEPPMWKKDEIRRLSIRLENGRILGEVELRTASGSRGFVGEIQGIVEVENGRVSRFDCVAQGEYWGEGQYTPGAPEGKFPLAVTFRLGDMRDPADRVPPEGSRFWVDGYLRPQ